MKVHYVCTECGKRESVTSCMPKCPCGGLWKLEYQLPEFDLELIDRTQRNIFRYRRFMPLIDSSWNYVSMGEGLTPIISFDEDLLMKMDYFMPTLSFKDRGAAVLISHCKAIGIKSVIQDSSGNAGNSIAAYSGRVGITCEIYVPESTSSKKIDMIKAHGAGVHVVQGSRDYCADVCRDIVEKQGIYYANHVYNPYFYEGTKTYIYEVYEQLHRIPQNIFIPLGNGTLFLGVIYALEHLYESGIISQFPNIVAVQSERCAPIAKAVKLKSKILTQVEIKETLAEGIAIGHPMRGKEILQKIYKYKITVIEIPEEDILPARKILAQKGIYCEHTTAGVYAAYIRYCRLYGKITDCLISMCGAGLKSDH